MMNQRANRSGVGSGKHPDHYLAEWREYRGYSVRGLAGELGVSHSRISRIETGDTELRPSFAKKVAKFFNIPMGALFSVNPLGEGKQTAEMLDIWAAMPQAQRADMLRIMRALQNGKSDNGKG